MSEPRATYRLQLHRGFGFAAAAELVDYLAELGISHLYVSPCLQAEPGSTHGYDVVDPGRISEDLGGAPGWATLIGALRERHMGLVLDVVPNHMSIAGTSNQWWWDVLENGPSSHYASYFDVDWHPAPTSEDNRILLPVLGERYGVALQSGAIRVRRREGSFVVELEGRTLPVAPRSLPGILREAGARADSEELGFFGDTLEALPLATATDWTSTRRRHRDKAVLGRQLARLFAEEPAAAAAVDAVLEELNADPVRLDQLLEHQNWRLSHWSVAASELGYRRFFDVTHLAGLRVELPHVFEDTHRLVLDWLREGTIDGLRIDHPDGLRDPEQYFARLRRAAPGAWIIAEKILHHDEALPESWPIDGTTGYDFMALCTGVLVDPAAEAPLTALAERMVGPGETTEALLDASKERVLDALFGSELSRLVSLLERITARHPSVRDYSRGELSAALREILLGYACYRSYVRVGAPVRVEDRRIVEQAVTRAERNASIDPVLLAFIRDVLLLARSGGEEEKELALRVQQLTGAIQAKAVEDTTFYRDLRLLALNEVGGAPERFGLSLEALHQALASRQHPRSMLASSTHDTKRSEDVRCRLAALSEVPGEWAALVERLSARVARYLTGELPDGHAQYLLFQTLVGAWPLDQDRAQAYMEKAVREAKRRTSWRQPDEVYESALRSLVASVFADPELLQELGSFVERIEPAARQSSLSMTLLKLTAPGVPDFYQGCELWEHSLVDPDNRRPVDFARRRELLARLLGATPVEVMATQAEGGPKQWLIARSLRLRAAQPSCFEGAYRTVPGRGRHAQRVIAWQRGEALIAVAPRWILGLEGGWQDTHVELPAGRWCNELGGEELGGGVVPLERLLASFPVALLRRT